MPRRPLVARRSDNPHLFTTYLELGLGAVAVVVGLVWFVMFLAGWRSVPPDKVLLHYTGGPVQGTHFKQLVAPGTHTRFYGLLEHYYYLPATQRNYIISKQHDEGDVSSESGDQGHGGLLGGADRCRRASYRARRDGRLGFLGGLLERSLKAFLALA